jgi:hypothetical protein
VQSTTHTSSTPPSTVVIGADDDDSAQYRTISVLSLVSLAFGLASPLAFFGPLLMVLPIAGAVLALLAVRRIALSDGTLIGRTAALLALALSVASITAAFTRVELSHYLLSRQARATALEWFTLLQQGETEQASQLMSNSRQRPAPANPDNPNAAPATSPLDEFRAGPVVHFMLEHARSAPVRYDRSVAIDLFTTGEARIQQQYSVGVPPTNGDGTVSMIDLVLQRSRGAGGGPFEWLVSSATSDDVPTEPHEHDHDHGHDHAGHVH